MLFLKNLPDDCVKSAVIRQISLFGKEKFLVFSINGFGAERHIKKASREEKNMKKTWFRCGAAWLFLWIFCCQIWAMPKQLVPGGCTVGIKLYSRGVIVTGVDPHSAAEAAGLKKGDVILAVDGAEVHTAEGLRRSLDDEIVLTVLRKGKQSEVPARPKETAEGHRLGAYIRDSMAGIGTVTYCDPETGDFGALGHGVNDADTRELLPLEAGVVVPSSVSEIKRGQAGEPGELKGIFDVRQILGAVEENTDEGIFGTMKTPLQGKPLPVAEPFEVKPGAASILSNIHGREVQTYSVEILKIYSGDRERGRNMLLQVTDPELLQQTGGIVQGMSGSPIIQDGKLVGAVTHVLVNDPTRGYGIFIENMLDAAG